MGIMSCGSTCAATPAVSATIFVTVYPPDMPTWGDMPPDPPDPPDPPTPPYWAVAAPTTPSSTAMQITDSTLFDTGNSFRGAGVRPHPLTRRFATTRRCSGLTPG